MLEQPNRKGNTDFTSATNHVSATMSFRFFRRKSRRKLKLSEEWKKSLAEIPPERGSEDSLSAYKQGTTSKAAARPYVTLGSAREISLLKRKLHSLNDKLRVRNEELGKLRKANETLTTSLERSEKALYTSARQLEKVQMQLQSLTFFEGSDAGSDNDVQKHNVESIPKQDKSKPARTSLASRPVLEQSPFEDETFVTVSDVKNIEKELDMVKNIPPPPSADSLPLDWDSDRRETSDCNSISTQTTTRRCNMTATNGWSPKSRWIKRKNRVFDMDTHLEKIENRISPTSSPTSVTGLFSALKCAPSEDDFQSERLGF